MTRNRSTPFSSHSAFKPLPTAEDAMDLDEQVPANSDDTTNPVEEPYVMLNAAGSEFDIENFEFDNDVLVDTWEGESCKEELNEIIQLLQDFVSGLEYQVQFQDHRFLKILEKEGAGFFRLARKCLGRERRPNSSRETSYRSRPRRDNDI